MNDNKIMLEIDLSDDLKTLIKDFNENLKKIECGIAVNEAKRIRKEMYELDKQIKLTNSWLEYGDEIIKKGMV